MVVPLRGTKDITVSFGKSPYFSADVAPMNIRDVKITRDGELIRYWKYGNIMVMFVLTKKKELWHWRPILHG